MAETRTIPLAQVQALSQKWREKERTHYDLRDTKERLDASRHRLEASGNAFGMCAGELDALIASASPPCAWSLDDIGGDSTWETSCGQSFVFDNSECPCSIGLRWCGYCGKPLIEIRSSDKADPPPAPASERPETERL